MFKDVVHDAKEGLVLSARAAAVCVNTPLVRIRCRDGLAVLVGAYALALSIALPLFALLALVGAVPLSESIVVS